MLGVSSWRLWKLASNFLQTWSAHLGDFVVRLCAIRAHPERGTARCSRLEVRAARIGLRCRVVVAGGLGGGPRSLRPQALGFRSLGPRLRGSFASLSKARWRHGILGRPRPTLCATLGEWRTSTFSPKQSRPKAMWSFCKIPCARLHRSAPSSTARSRASLLPAARAKHWSK